MAQDSGRILAVSISSQKGQPKENVHEAMLIEDWGLEGDAHAGKWNRQVSLLAFEAIQRMRELGAEVEPGDFGENLTLEGFDLKGVRVGDLLAAGDAILEVTQIGKECHTHCAIYEQVGECVMPVEGIFARVVKGGKLKAGMGITRIEAGAGADA